LGGGKPLSVDAKLSHSAYNHYHHEHGEEICEKLTQIGFGTWLRGLSLKRFVDRHIAGIPWYF